MTSGYLSDNIRDAIAIIGLVLAILQTAISIAQSRRRRRQRTAPAFPSLSENRPVPVRYKHGTNGRVSGGVVAVAKLHAIYWIVGTPFLILAFWLARHQRLNSMTEARFYVCAVLAFVWAWFPSSIWMSYDEGSARQQLLESSSSALFCLSLIAVSSWFLWTHFPPGTARGAVAWWTALCIGGYGALAFSFPFTAQLRALNR